MLQLKNIKKVYNGVPILNGISLDIGKGEIVSILGPSGSGKTTLLNVILGLAELDGGQILFDGEDVSGTPMQRRGFNIVFQDYALFPNLNAYRNITYGLKNKPGVSSPREVRELVELLGLSEHLDKRIDQLSGGQKQRVAIVRSLAMNPDVILFDETTSAHAGDEAPHPAVGRTSERPGRRHQGVHQVPHQDDCPGVQPDHDHCDA